MFTAWSISLNLCQNVESRNNCTSTIVFIFIKNCDIGINQLLNMQPIMIRIWNAKKSILTSWNILCRDRFQNKKNRLSVLKEPVFGIFYFNNLNIFLVNIYGNFNQSLLLICVIVANSRRIVQPFPIEC